MSTESKNSKHNKCNLIYGWAGKTSKESGRNKCNLIHEKETLEDNSEKKLCFSSLLFIVAIICILFVLIQYIDNKKELSASDLVAKTKEIDLNYDLKEATYNLNILMSNRKEYLNQIKKMTFSQPKNIKDSQNKKNNIEKHDNALNDINIEIKESRKKLETIKYQVFFIAEMKKRIFSMSFSNLVVPLFFLLLALSGSIAIFISYRLDQKKIHAIIKDIDQYQRFELAEKQCVILESNEKLPDVSGMDIFGLGRKIYQSEQLWDKINSYEKADYSRQKYKEEEYKKNRQKAQYIDEEIYTQISRLKLPQKKSIQVRADLIKAIYSYNREKA